MRWLLAWTIGAIGTAALVTRLHAHTDASGQPLTYALAMLLLALGLWPLMLVGEIWVWFRERRRHRQPRRFR